MAAAEVGHEVAMHVERQGEWALVQLRETGGSVTELARVHVAVLESAPDGLDRFLVLMADGVGELVLQAFAGAGAEVRFCPAPAVVAARARCGQGAGL